jgi:phage-related tail fiber protein
VATTSVAGFLSAPDKTKLDGVSEGSAALTLSAPVNVTKAAAAVGVATDAARADHQHDITTATVGAAAIGDSATEGSATSLARSDHTHSIAGGIPVAIGTANAAGSATTFTRSDHVHDHGAQTSGTLHAVVTTSVAGFMSAADKADFDSTVTAIKQPVRAATTANITLSGTQTIDGVSVVAADRVLVKDQITGANNGIYVAATGAWTRSVDFDNSAEVRGGLIVAVSEGTTNANRIFQLISDDPIALGSTALVFATPVALTLTAAAPVDVTKAAAAVGVATDAARADHKHDISTAIPVNVTKAAAAEGTATSLARSDHKHDITTAATGAVAIGGAATEGTAVSLARSDHTHSVAGGTPVAIGIANSGGAATTFTRSDHVHDHGAQTSGTLHAVATTAIAGFMSAADKVNFDSITTAIKQPVRAATTANITLSAPQTIDGVSVIATQRVLVKDQSTGSQNGIYVVAAGAWVRAVDFDASSEVRGGTVVPVSEGTANGNKLFQLTTDDPITLAVTGLAFATPVALTLTAAPPADVTKAAAAVGVATDAAKADHKHDVSTATPAAGAVAVGNVAAEGTATSLARSDHTHTVTAAVPVAIGTANSTGSATTLVRSDHVHDHGAQTSGTLHAAATTSVAGFLSASDKTKLDGVSAGAAPLTSTAPADVTKAAAAVGVATDAARADHKHDVTTATPVTGAVAVGNSEAEGTATTLARSDHQHTVTAATPVAIGTANAAGTATTFVRSDHVHDHGAQTSGTLHSAVTGLTNGFMLAADKTKLDGVAVSAAALASTAPVDITKSTAVVGTAADAARADHKHDVTTAVPVAGAVAAGNTAAEGTATTLARSDHQHTIAVVAPSTIGTVNSAGSAATFVRSDHVHDHGAQTVATLHAVVTGAANGFMLAADKTKLDGVSAAAAALASSAPVDITKAAATVGIGTTAARVDHKHDIATAAAGVAAIGDLATEGSAVTMARSDHTHSIAAGIPVAVGIANSAGVATTFARSDHVHDHGTQSSGTLHAAATTSVSGFLSATDKTRLDGMATGAAALASTAPSDVTKAAAAVGVGATAARADHKHDVSTAVVGAITAAASAAEGTAITLARSDHTHSVAVAVPVAIGTANAAGVATTFIRSDHVHDHGAQTSGTLHAVVTSSANGFMLAADKVNLDSTVTAIKQPVRLASTANLTLSGTQTIDGVSAVAGDRVLAKDQSTGSQNGIYAVAAGAWSRAVDFDADAEVRAAVIIRISEGAANGDHVAILTTNDPITVGTTALTFSVTQVVGLTSNAPADVTKAAAVAGVATDAARSDHKHDVTTATPAAGAVAVGNSAVEGTATTLARSDHQHTVAAAAPVAIGTANAAGAATTFVRSDHVHDHGAQTSGTLHAAVTTSVNGFMVATDKTKLDSIPLQRRWYQAADLTSPVNANWTVNAFAPLSADLVNIGLSVRRFDDTTQEGVSWSETIPPGATNVTLYFKSRAQTAPGGTVAVVPALYRRTIPDNAAVGAWSSVTNLTAISIPTNTNFQYDSQTITLSSLSLSAGTFVQYELTRVGTNVSDTLAGDWVLLELGVEYT